MRAQLAGLALSACLAVAGCTGAPAPLPGGSTPAAPTASVSVPAVGSCTGPIDVDGGSVTSLTTISCDQPHYWEVQSSLSVSGESYPGAAALAEQAKTGCSQGFSDYVGVEPGYARYTSAYVVPDQAAWAQPSTRGITCLVGSADGGLTGSAKGDVRIFPEVGQCTGPQDVPALELAIQDCAGEHHYEVFAAKAVTTAKAPTEKELTKLFATVCVAGFTKFVGVAVGKSKYEVSYFIASKDLWSKVGDHRIVCSAGSPKGGITGSLKGVKK